MYHSITFGAKNTWEDWHLIPQSRPHVEPPEARTIFIEATPKNGDIDLTEIQNGETLYNNSEGTWTFFVANDYEPWEIIYSKMLNYLHGRRFAIHFEDDPGHTYNGRFFLKEPKAGKTNSAISIDYILDPWPEDRELARFDIALFDVSRFSI